MGKKKRKKHYQEYAPAPSTPNGKPLVGYRCSRGCGADIGAPANQDIHNIQAHLAPRNFTTRT
jgi:hypothetical protein